MSIALPAGLRARRELLTEGVDVLDLDQLRAWGRRPLRLCLVNLMPDKALTETQFARLLGGSSIPVELVFCLPDGYRSKSMSADHMAFYRRWAAIRHEEFDGFVVTGAPLESLPFEDVAYWTDLCAIFDWARSRRIASLYICWAAQAALYHFHGVAKHRLDRKKFGVFVQHVTNGASPLLSGFGEAFPAPVSRHTEVRAADLPIDAGLSVLAASPSAGLCLLEDRGTRAVYMFNHLEYDAETLRDEFLRDRRAGKPVEIPRGYFPDDDPARAPANRWRSYGHLLFANWLGQLRRTGPQILRTGVADPADLAAPAGAGHDILPAAIPQRACNRIKTGTIAR
jgi:homoserine O-succinyltransferase